MGRGLKQLLGFAVLGAIVYLVFFVPVDGQTPYERARQTVKDRVEYVCDRVETAAGAFLGLTVGCIQNQMGDEERKQALAALGHLGRGVGLGVDQDRRPGRGRERCRDRPVVVEVAVERLALAGLHRS